jgi:hypothetical protein
VTGHVKVIHKEWADGDVRRFDIRCVCGWKASTSDGWEALAEFYRHAGFPSFAARGGSR